ncbi:MAG: YihY/virulence factor BrkB family protein [Clostridiales bacterium]|nr:YihY/virulence factor BrkB family protein [Clostridiales bacterium]
MIGFFLDCRRIWERFSRDEITVYAAHASFFIVIAAVPFMMILLTLIQFIPQVGKSDLLELLVRLMPDMLDSLIVSIIDDLYVKSPATIISITALLALWSASRGMMGIERGLNRVYGTDNHRGYILRRLICTGYTFVFMIACLISLILIVLGSGIQNIILSVLPVLGNLVQSIISFRALLSMALLLLCFIGLYSVLPSRRQDPWQQVPGALFSTAGWMIFSYLFSVYFTHFSNFSYMYGSLTAIFLLMLWLYFCICILFLGAEINVFLERQL